MLRRGRDLLPGLEDVCAPAGDDKDGLLAAHWGLDVRVRLGAEGFDLATWNGERGEWLFPMRKNILQCSLSFHLECKNINFGQYGIFVC